VHKFNFKFEISNFRFQENLDFMIIFDKEETEKSKDV